MTARVLYRGATEYVEASVTSDVTLDTQPVAFSFDGGTTWTAAAWTGSPALTRTARLLVVASTTFTTPGIYTLLVKVTDSPEVPVISAGGVTVR